MNTSKTQAIAVMLVLVGLTSGCQRSRLLSRNDYASMHDPFMDAEPTIATAAAGGEGVARMPSNGMPPATSSAQRPRRTAAVALTGGPKPIDGTISSSTGRGDIPVARATYPSDAGIPAGSASRSRRYPGPSLSDFMSKDSGNASSKPKNEVASAELQDFAKFVDSSAPPPAAPSPAAEAESEASKLASLIGADMGKLDPSPATETKTPPAMTSPAATSNVFAGGPTDYFPAGESAIVPPPSSSNAPTAPAGNSSVSAQAPLPENPFAALNAAAATAETVQPAQPTEAPEFDDASIAAAVAAESFDNPFPDLAESSATPGTGSPWVADESAAATTSTSGAFPETEGLDSAFRMDTGWKPSHLVAK